MENMPGTGQIDIYPDMHIRGRDIELVDSFIRSHALKLTSNSGNQLIATRAACARLSVSHVSSRDSQSSFNRTPVKHSYLPNAVE